MSLTRCVLAATVLLSFSASLPQSFPGPENSFGWAAYPEAGEGLYVNPAAGSFLRGLRFRLGFSASDSSIEKIDMVDLSLSGAGFGIWWGDDILRYTTSLAMRAIGDNVSLGFSYSWFRTVYSTSQWHDKSTWSAGITVRPVSWLGTGAFYRSGVETSEQEVSSHIGAGIAIRPFERLITLTGDLHTSSDFGDISFSGGFELRPIEGLAVRGSIDEDGFTAGLGMEFGHFGVSGAGSFNNDAVYGSARGEILYSTASMENLAGSGMRYVRFSPGETDELPHRPFLGPRQRSFTEQMMLLDFLVDDSSVEGIILDVRHGTGNPAQTEELRNQLARFRSTGREVYVFVQTGGNAECYLASVGRSFIHPAGEIALTGLAGTSFFARDLLDNLGIYPDLLHIGEFKSASDMLTRSDMSEAQRTATTALLTSMQAELMRGISLGRDLEPAQLSSILEKGLYTADRAVSAGLVDGIARVTEIVDRIEEETGRRVRVISLDGYASEIPCAVQWEPEPHVAVVVATGTITTGKSGDMFPLGRTMGSETVVSILEEAASAPGVRAIVLRIDTGGGDALASDDIHHAISEIRQHVPVVVSMGGVAASGGYYIACSSDRIYADALTVTGSIGIISGKFSFGGLLEKIGINAVHTSITPVGGIGSPFRPYTETERERVFQMMSDGYDLFVTNVAEGRNMTWAEVDSIGRGRVWSGTDAVEIGIVDRIGGVADAVAYAATLGGIDQRHPAIRIYPEPPALGTLEFPGFGLQGALSEFVMEPPLEGRLLYIAAPLNIE